MALRADRRRRNPSTTEGYAQSTFIIPVWMDDYIRTTADTTRRSNSLVASEVIAAGISATDPAAVPAEESN